MAHLQGQLLGQDNDGPFTQSLGRLQRHEPTQSETRSGSRYAQLELDRANGQLGGT